MTRTPVWTLTLTLILTLLQVLEGVQEDNVPPTNILGQLRHYLGELGSVAGEIGAGVSRLSRQIRNVEEFLDATLDEDCYFQCPKGIYSQFHKITTKIRE